MSRITLLDSIKTIRYPRLLRVYSGRFDGMTFEPTQLLGRARGSGYEPGGREFESLRARHKSNIYSFAILLNCPVSGQVSSVFVVAVLVMEYPLPTPRDAALAPARSESLKQPGRLSR